MTEKKAGVLTLDASAENFGFALDLKQVRHFEPGREKEAYDMNFQICEGHFSLYKKQHCNIFKTPPERAIPP